MVIAAVDPNKQDLKRLIQFLRMTDPVSNIVMFSDPRDAAGYILDNPIDVLFTEIDMPSMSGFDLQQVAEAVQPAVLTIFASVTQDYVAMAIRTSSTGYIQKPVSRQAVRESLSNIKFGCTIISDEMSNMKQL